MKEIHADNPKDFNDIYMATMQLLFKISFRIVGTEDAAEDLAHDSLIKAHEKALVFPSIDDAKYVKAGKQKHTKRLSTKKAEKLNLEKQKS